MQGESFSLQPDLLSKRRICIYIIHQGPVSFDQVKGKQKKNNLGK